MLRQLDHWNRCPKVVKIVDVIFQPQSHCAMKNHWLELIGNLASCYVYMYTKIISPKDVNYSTKFGQYFSDFQGFVYIP